MDNYTIRVQPTPPDSAIPEFYRNGFLFNEAKHLRHQQNEGFYLLTALNQTTHQVDARCAFFVREGQALSPLAAPFGSIEFAETLTDPVLDAFIQALIEAARSVGASTIRLVNYPTCYAPKQTAQLTAKLPEHGFNLVETQQTFVLPVTDGSFAHNLAPAERRRLRKCQNAGFQFRHWQTPNATTVVDFIVETHRQKGYGLTIHPERLANLLHEFPDQCAVFTVSDGSTIAALTLTIRVRHDILYNFRPMSHPDYDRFSPMVMLTDGLFAYCQHNKIQWLDLGTSLDGAGQPKPGLMRFKRNLGAQESPKLSFGKTV